MLIIGMMVIALICLAVGLALPSSAWLIASLIATAGSGYLVWKMRSAIAPATAGHAGAASETTAPTETGAADVDTPAADEDADDATSQTTVIPAVRSRTDDAAETTLIPAVRSRRDDAASRTTVIPAVPAATTAADRSGGPSLGPAGPDEVWVIDGRPRYHLGNCPIIQGQDAEPIPFDQAVEDGFMPCSLCEPNYASAGR